MGRLKITSAPAQREGGGVADCSEAELVQRAAVLDALFGQQILTRGLAR